MMRHPIGLFMVSIRDDWSSPFTIVLVAAWPGVHATAMLHAVPPFTIVLVAIWRGHHITQYIEY
jgi:hypothetical protein